MHLVHVSIGALPPVFSNYGGAIQRRVGELALTQARQGHQVTVFSPGSAAAVESRDGVTVRYVKTRLPAPLSYLAYQARVVTTLRRQQVRPDVLHFHSEPEGAATARPLNTACVLSYDNYRFRVGPKSPLAGAYRRALRAFDALLPCSNYCAEGSTASWKLPRDRLHVIYNGVNLEQFRPDPEAAAQERNVSGIAGKVILYLGRVCEQKGTDTLLQAFAPIRRAHPDAELLIAGPLEQFSATGGRIDWNALIRDSGGHYLGQVPDERLPALLNLADVFVMPTRRLEMFGMAAIEAQACGTPVVASDHGGLRETVPREAGLRFPVGDSTALAEAVTTLLSDPGLRHRLGAAARAHAERFGWERIARDLEPVYRGVIALRATSV